MTGNQKIICAVLHGCGLLAVCITTGRVAFAETADSEIKVVASLKYMSELNRLRETNRTGLTAQL